MSAPKPEDTVALKAIFDKHDDNKNGVIDKHELPAVLEDSLKRKLPASLMDKYVSTVFAKHDKDNNNTIDFNEFCALYKQVYSDPELPIAMGYKQVERNVQLESGQNAPKHEKVIVTLSEEQKAEAKAVFDGADKDKSGHLNKEELLHALKDKLGKKLSEKMVERMVEAQMQLGDTNSDGLIDLEEFYTLWGKLQQQAAGPAAGGAPKGFALPPMM